MTKTLEQDDGSTIELKQKLNKLVLIAGKDYGFTGSKLAKLTDTGNGFIFKNYSHSSMYQDNYICLSYSEAEYLRIMLNELESKREAT